MARLRNSISGIMILVALFAIEVAALRSGEDGWLDACRFVTVMALLMATFQARGRRGEEGAFWFGFATVGWATFMLVLHTLAAERYSDSVISRLPILVWSAIADRPLYNSYSSTLRSMRQLHILHLMLVLPAGLLGGLISGLAARRRRRRGG